MFYSETLRTVCNLQSMKTLMELHGLFLNSFVTWFDQTRPWGPSKRGLYVKFYYKLQADNT